MASSTSSTPLSTLTSQTIAQISAMVTDKLTTKNYITWQDQVLPLIEGISMADHILADSKAPTATIVADSGKEEPNPAFSIWQQEDRLVKSLITATLASEVRPFTVRLSTAREIWKILEDRFANSSKQRARDLLRKLQEVKRNEHTTLEAYLQEVKMISNELAAINQPVDDSDKVYWSLNGLDHDKYDSFITAMQVRSPSPSFDEFTNLLSEYEKHRKTNLVDEKQALIANRGRGRSNNRSFRGRSTPRGRSFSYDNRNNNRGSSFHSQQQLQQGSQKTNYQNQRSYVTCQICNKPGHKALNCQERFNHAYQDSDVPKALAALSIHDADDPEWIADTGAHSHLTNDPGNLINVRPYKGSSRIMVGNGKRLKITHIGDASISRGSSQLLLKNVLVVLDIIANLISIGQLLDDSPGIFIIFSPSGFVIKDKQTWKTIASGVRKDGLYLLGEDKMIQTQFERKIKVFQSDGGGEFNKTEFLSFLAEECHAPKRLWLEAVHTAVFLINRTPTPTLNMSSPYKVLYNKDPNYSFLRSFGCHCRIYISRHVIFDENNFPFMADCTSANLTKEEIENPSTWLNLLDNEENQNLLRTTSAPSIFDATSHDHQNIQERIMQIEAEQQNCHSSSAPCNSTADPLPMTNTNTSPPQPYSQAATSKNTTSSLPHLGRHLQHNTHPMTTRGKLKAGLLHLMFDQSTNIPQEPKSLKTALAHSGWHKAMQEELQALSKNHTWTLVPRQPSMNIIGSKWVYKTKLKADVQLSPQTIRIVLTIALSKGWEIKQLDVQNAFLHGFLKEPVYMEQPPGFHDSKHPEFVTRLHEEFAMKDLGNLNYFLGIQVSYTSRGILLSQQKYAHEILQRADMINCNSIATPMINKSSTLSHQEPFADPSLFHSLVGALQYLTITRPELCYVVNTVCQVMHSPTVGHFQLVKRILRYVKGTSDHGLHLLKDSSLDLYGFSDADWASCSLTRRSVTGYAIFLGSNLISWGAKKQPTVARSSAEAEYRAIASTAAELIWLATILRDLGIHLS
ncbi:hypothetical protein CCACVL1_29719 [Corchorus capsularis]|uniref:Uncharacterized protein n=1 Tax=Corchorus capsularis TaxID=210143 RepID=A0A1R3G0G2_COCAP|nr:hypothetical protein CCACVL1_29719 [Corchorus capsularis]